MSMELKRKEICNASASCYKNVMQTYDVVYYRRRDKLRASVQRMSYLGFLRTRTSPDADTKCPTSPPCPTYEEIEEPSPPPPVYSKPHKPAPAAAASVPVINAATDKSSVYRDTSTTLIDNALYGAQQPSVTSSHVAETGDDVTDLTVIDNDLYERKGQGQGQENSGSTDYECTLVDNDLYC